MNEDILLNEVIEVLASAGISAKEAADSISEAMKMMPPIDVNETMAMIQLNPSLSVFQRWRLIRYLRDLASVK